jgi:hypothetical protein
MVFSLASVIFLGLGSNSYNKFGKARERQGRRIVQLTTLANDKAVEPTVQRL